ncbi:MAG TPA: 50S ribosomal protein L21 [Candidatus Paceibacterota bacterium]|nr:50S ribosomal protein L21 [Candidatus Paceibacterota bacterium]
MANDFSVIETGGKQYRVSAGQKLKVEKLEVKAGDKIIFDTVLLTSIGDAVKVGAPYVVGAKTEAKVLGDVRGEKKIVFKYHSKTRARKKKGHKQDYTEIEITKI